MPMAVPTMPDSARGESQTRLSPNSAFRASVILKTPAERANVFTEYDHVRIFSEGVAKRGIQCARDADGRRRGLLRGRSSSGRLGRRGGRSGCGRRLSRVDDRGSGLVEKRHARPAISASFGRAISV